VQRSYPSDRPAATPDHQDWLTRAPASRTGYLLYLAHRHARAATNAVLAAHGLDLRHLAVLGYLANAGPASQRQLTRALQMDKSTMVNVIDDLERQRLAERQRSARDRRANAVHITDDGRRRLERAFESATQAMERLLAPFSPAERHQLNELLARFVDHAGEKMI
jgi:DNA-binding MarR family transcriptional regulator